MSARHHIVAGTPVRLSFDSGAKSVGYVREVVDAVRLRLEFPSDNGSADGEFIDGRVSVIVMPRHVVVPVCEWVDTYADEWGMACSEPGVPTSFDVPCHHDATTTVRFHPAFGDPDEPTNVCDEHAKEYDLPSVVAEPITR